MYWRFLTCTSGVERLWLRFLCFFAPVGLASSQYSGVLAFLIPAVLQGRRPTIYGDGLQSRDFTYVRNVVEANLLACKVPGVGGQVFNVACGDRITVNSMLQQINKITGKDVAPIHADARAGDIKHSQADITRAKEHLGYDAKVGFEEGLRQTIEWYRRNTTA